ncbi:pirin family protein [Alteromonas oceanisediminis]|uniref:pirin family protein n=1 Tax=Alteromonas oceanisediminis TaxID=2836180 RepID=UPI001BD95568|nr:pirin family protein [Alteromonas oceanisediminis]MBT0586488.1 pirin family protein [Alteromonas oceanisediminis]
MTASIVQRVRGVSTADGAGVKLRRVIGQPLLARLDPFLMLDEFGSDKASDYLAGFPPHPHRGFQTVTYMLKGRMRHKDSVGNEGLIEDGGIQWMNAGRGIIHEEMPEQSSGLMRGFQLWVNLPAALKLSEPDYQDIPSSDVPQFDIDDGLECRLLSGKLDLDRRTVSGPVKTISAQLSQPFFADLFTTTVDKSSEQTVNATVALDPEYQYFVYCYEGSITVEDRVLHAGELGTLTRDHALAVTVSPKSAFIVVGGQPINEPVVQYGPFVMNTQAEIEQALQDYQSGNFV